MPTSVGEQAAVAAVLMGVVLASTVLEDLIRFLEDFKEVLRVQHQLFEVTGASRYTVVKDEVALTDIGPGYRFVRDGGQQVAWIATELLSETQVERRNKGMNVAVHIETRHRKQHADSLRCEFPIKKACLNDLLFLFLAPVPAIYGMVNFAVLSDLSACAAQLKGSIYQRSSRDGQLRAASHLLSEVHLP